MTEAINTDVAAVQGALTQFDAVGAGIAALKERFGGVLYPMETTEGMEAAKLARKIIREPRYEIEQVRKSAKAPLLAIGKRLDSEAARITAELLQIEEPIDRQIKAEEERKEREKQARIDAELKRVASIHERIAELRGNPSLTPTSGMELISDHIADLEGLAIDDSFAEFRQQAIDAKTGGLARLRELHAAAVAHEAEQARVRAERQELARLRAEQDARDAAERDRRAAEDRARAEAERAAQEERDAAARTERERLAAERAENERLAREARERNEAEERRIREAREQLERDQAAARAARTPPAEVPTTPAAALIRGMPSADEIVSVLQDHYKVPRAAVLRWLARITWTEEA